MAETYYERLGVSPDASEDEIESAYREKLKETHPDVSDETDAKQRTQGLIEAKEVLTDEKERSRYDRLGHQKYVSLERQESSTPSGDDASSSAGEGTTTTGAGDVGAASGQGAAAGGGAATSSGSGTATGAGTGTANAAGTSASTESTTFGGGEAGSASWYDGRSGSGDAVGDGSWRSNEEDTWRAWNTEGSYAVSRSNEPFRQGNIFSSDKIFGLLSVTFLVYPVLLFGALFPGFPLIFRFLVAICTVLLIAFLQSIPEVGIAVFGTWSVMLPLVLFSAGVELMALTSVLAMAGVMFPLGLSLLTRLAIRPATA
jgi:molecular chaperone DnaJ